MEKNMLLGACVIIFGSLFLWGIIALAIIGGVTVAGWIF